MLQWTTSVDTGIQTCYESNYLLEKRRAVVLNKRVWYVEDIHLTDPIRHLLQVASIDTESLHLERLDFDIDNDNFYLESVTGDGDYLYIFMAPLGEPMSNKMLKIDTKSGIVVERRVWDSPSIEGDVIAYGNELYFLDNSDGLYLRIMTPSEIRRSTFELESELGHEYTLMLHDEKMYLFELSHTERKVWYIDQNLQQHLKSHDVWIERTRTVWCQYTYFANGIMAIPIDKIVEDRSIRREKVVIDMYDFENHKWNRQVIEDFHEYGNYSVVTAVEHHNDKIFIFVRSEWPITTITVRVIDINPSLTDICLLNAAKKILARGALLGAIKNQTPVPYRAQLVAMVEARSPGFGFLFTDDNLDSEDDE